MLINKYLNAQFLANISTFIKEIFKVRAGKFIKTISV